MKQISCVIERVRRDFLQICIVIESKTVNLILKNYDSRGFLEL